jgi:hypothetical protein
MQLLLWGWGSGAAGDWAWLGHVQCVAKCVLCDLLQHIANGLCYRAPLRAVEAGAAAADEVLHGQRSSQAFLCRAGDS